MRTKRLNNFKGFTLIELLIVISIIGVLAALLMANFIGVRQRARDAQRKTDVRQIQAALELYRADIGAYPAALSTCLGDPDCSDTSTIYMQEIPSDPNGDEYYNSGNYCFNINGSKYYLVACLENAKDSQGTSTLPADFTPCSATSCSTNFYYVVKNP